MRHAFSLVELLVALALLGILAAVLLPNLMAARRLALDRAALAYAHNVYKAAWAYRAESPAHPLPTGDCTAGFSVGGYRARPAPGSLQSCEVQDAGNGTPRVVVQSRFGRTYTLP